MKLDKNHPKLSAYALGDLPAKEMKAMKPFIEKDPELSKIVREITEFADAMNQGFALEKPKNFSATKSERLRNIPKASRKKTVWIWSGVLAPVMVALFLLINPETKQTISRDTLWSPKDDSDSVSWEGEMADKSAKQRNSTMSISDGEISEPSGRNLSPLGVGAGKVPAKPEPSAGYTEFKSNKAGPERASPVAKNTLGLGSGKGAVNNFGAGDDSPSGGLGSAGGVTRGLRERAQAKPKKEYMLRKSPSPIAPPDAFFAEEDGNQFSYIEENDFKNVKQSPLSTFGIDVDTGSYTIARQYLNQNQRPPVDSVRIEELINYFDYNYEPPTDGRPFAVHLEAANAPWAEGHRLVRVGLKAKEIQNSERKAANLVFLLDVSGSMSASNKLPLLKESFKILLRNLNADDRVAIVVYAGASGLVLPSTKVSDEKEIYAALDRLSAGGSTNGGGGITLAYKIARENFKKDGINRVILGTDGDFNVGLTRQGDLIRLVQKEAKDNIFLTVLGFGMGNFQDATLESIANKGNGSYAYIDSQGEADKVFSKQITGTLETVAKDVKIQVEFNPEVVESYRLIGYENRTLAAEDFNNDKKDAGEIGAGHSVTAIYEVVPVGIKASNPSVDPLKYQKKESSWFDIFKGNNVKKELLTIKLRYKNPDEDKSKLFSKTLVDGGKSFSEASESFRFASSVAAYGMILRNSKYKGSAKLDHIIKSAGQSRSFDPNGYKKEFMDLLSKSKDLPGLNK